MLYDLEKGKSIRSCVNRTLQIPLALSHNTTGSSGNSTPELEFAEKFIGLGFQRR